MKRTTAPGSSTGVYVDKDTDAGIPGTALMAEDRNIIQEQIALPIEDAGFTLIGTDNYQLERAIISLSKKIGEVIPATIALTPVPLSASRSSDNPSYPIYNPIIPLHDANHDITTAEVPQAVIDVLNSNKVVVKDGAGVNVSSFPGTLASGVVTLSSTTENVNFIGVLQEAGMVNRWYGTGEIGLWAADGALWTGARQYCITIAGSNYAVSAVNVVSRTITLATYPADGAVTVECYPHRIGGYTDRSRLRRVSGEAMVAGGDMSSEVAIGLARMHRLLGHVHNLYGYNSGSDATYPAIALGGSTTNFYQFTANRGGSAGVARGVGDQAPNTVNSLTTGKTNDVRSFGVGVYLHVGTLLATTWTSVA